MPPFLFLELALAVSLGGGFKHFFLFSPRSLGKIFTHFDGSHIFQRG